MALDEVSEADFWLNRHSKTRLIDLEGSGGQLWPENAKMSKFQGHRKGTRVVPHPAEHGPKWP